MNNDALLRFFSPETIAKFEMVAEVTAYQWKYGFERQLALFRMLALILATINDAASSTPLERPEDAGLFLLALASAEQAIQAALTAFIDNPDKPIEPESPYGFRERAEIYFEPLGYYVTDDYFIRRANVLARGKGPLLSQIVARMDQHFKETGKR